MEPAESADAAAPPPSEPVASPVVAAEAGGKDAILAAIQEAAITYDPTSLPAIAPHLGSQDPVVRAAAVDGIMLLGDAAGAPLLRRAADRSANAAESASLKAKAAYLELPPGKLLTPKKLEALRTRKAAGKAAAGQNP